MSNITLVLNPNGIWYASLWEDNYEIAYGTGDCAEEALRELGEKIDDIRAMTKGDDDATKRT